MSALLNLDSEVNTIHLAFAKKLGFVVQSTNIDAQKFNGIILETYGIVVAVFLVINQANKIKFFEEIFLVANVSLDVVLEILFFTLNGANVDFLKREL